MEPWIQKTRNGFVMAADEVARIHASPVKSSHEIGVQMDMKSWAIKTGLWSNEPYKDIIVLHAMQRGWLQEPFDGMEII
jgi:hypothetical protein